MAKCYTRVAVRPDGTMFTAGEKSILQKNGTYKKVASGVETKARAKNWRLGYVVTDNPRLKKDQKIPDDFVEIKPKVTVAGPGSVPSESDAEPLTDVGNPNEDDEISFEDMTHKAELIAYAADNHDLLLKETMTIAAMKDEIRFAQKTAPGQK